MKLTMYGLDNPIVWTGENVCTLVLENNKFYRETVSNALEQSTTGVGDFVLSEDSEILSFDKYAEVISDIFSADVAVNKSIVNGLQKDIAKIAQAEMLSELTETFANINAFLSKLSYASAFDIVFDDINDITALLKLYRFRPDSDALNLTEKILLYMELIRTYAKKQLFIVVGLKACLTDDEINCFFRDVVYRKINLLCIENQDRKSSIFETKIILDKDMCEL